MNINFGPNYELHYGNGSKIYQLFNYFKEIMARHNDYNLVMGIVARVIRASADGDRNSILVEPDVHFLNLAKKLIFFYSSSHTDLTVVKG